MPQHNQPDHIKQGKALASRVKQLRGHVGTDPSKAADLADALNEVTANRLVAHLYEDATAEAQEAVTAAARLLNEAGPVGAYTPPEVAARYYTAVTHVAVAQEGLGMPEAAGATMRTLDEFRAQLTRPLAQALHARTAVWALAVQGRACLASGDIAAANAWADAALTRVERSGLRDQPDETPVVLDAEQLISDTRWVAGRPDESLQHLHTARLTHAGWAGEDLANAARLSPAMLRMKTDPRVRIETALAERLASLGRTDEAAGVRRGLVELLRPVAGRMGQHGKQMLTMAQHEVEMTTDAGPVPDRLEGWTPVTGEATLAPEFEDAGGRTVEPALDIETLAAQRAAARAEADRQEREAAEAARVESERLAAERAERLAAAERASAEQAEREQAEREQAEREQEQAEARERAELDAENERVQQAERARQDAQRAALEQAEAAAMAEAERVRAEELAAEQAEREQVEREQVERAQQQADADEQERAEQAAREAAERAVREQAAQEQARQEEAARERAARDQAERERVEQERLEQERVEQERAAREAEAERVRLAEQAAIEPASDPLVQRWEQAATQLATERATGGRRAVRDAATEVVEALRPLAAADPGRWNRVLGEALEELSGARRGVADLWGARQASREARELLG